MEINYLRLKQITLNDRAVAYKPRREVLKKLSDMFPDIVIFGFGRYYQDYYYILAYSLEFPEDYSNYIPTVPMSQILKYKVSKPFSVVPRHN